MSIQSQTFVKIKDYEELLPGTGSAKTFCGIFVIFTR